NAVEGRDGQKTPDGLADAAGHEMRRGAEQVVEVPFLLLSLMQNLLGEFLAEEVPRKALGWSPQQVGVAQPTLNDRFKTAALDSAFAAGIKSLSPSRSLTDQSVEQQVAGRRVKAAQVLYSTMGGQV